LMIAHLVSTTTAFTAVVGPHYTDWVFTCKHFR
jgi:hypothetical protein